jgi:hypothetical protein
MNKFTNLAFLGMACLLLGCERERVNADRLALDTFLSSGLKKIMFVNDESNTTNTLSGEELQKTATFFSSTNRRAAIALKKTYAVGHVVFYDEYHPIAALHYSQEGMFSYGQYNFRLSATNDVLKWFPK